MGCGWSGFICTRRWGGEERSCVRFALIVLADCERGFAAIPFYGQAAVIASVVWVIHYFSGASAAPFIYSRF